MNPAQHREREQRAKTISSELEIRVTASAEFREVVIHLMLDRTRCCVSIRSQRPTWERIVHLPDDVELSELGFERLVAAVRKGLDVYGAHFG